MERAGLDASRFSFIDGIFRIEEIADSPKAFVTEGAVAGGTNLVSTDAGLEVLATLKNKRHSHCLLMASISSCAMASEAAKFCSRASASVI
jgi:hypothetical protein